MLSVVTSALDALDSVVQTPTTDSIEAVDSTQLGLLVFEKSVDLGGVHNSHLTNAKKKSNIKFQIKFFPTRGLEHDNFLCMHLIVKC